MRTKYNEDDEDECDSEEEEKEERLHYETQTDEIKYEKIKIAKMISRFIEGTLKSRVQYIS